ncbi:hypothetical protein PoB_001983200 [Plakobranchus ocellatus]|uniref:Uncharacterized protein n=1 Tax=Plakobranchus ocellatus TaxID=259542 RepID=A0AAV3ZFQ6_9GAST|nr:hypothetical protein PoB_001983200 [Plakobranchus ocellatus]
MWFSYPTSCSGLGIGDPIGDNSVELLGEGFAIDTTGVIARIVGDDFTGVNFEVVGVDCSGVIEKHSRSDNSVKRVNTTTKHSNCSTVIDSRDTDTLDLLGFAVNKSNREASSPPQPHRQYPWKKNRYRGFSPLPSASSSTEEEEDETKEEGEMQNESAEGSNKEGDREGTARASNSKRRRRWQKLKSLPLRHCHKRRLSPMADPIARRQLIAVVVLCLVFMVGEAVGE